MAAATDPQHRLRVPDAGPLPAHVGRRQRRLRALGQALEEGRHPRPRRRDADDGRAGVATARDCRRSCPAASSSGWPWHGCWPPTRPCCCSTSRCPRSTRTCATPSSTRSWISSGGPRKTAIYVTHDQSEAFAISDRIVVMNGGRIEQIGTQTDIYLHPQTHFVAEFIGANNGLPATVDDRGVRARRGRRSALGGGLVTVASGELTLRCAHAPARAVRSGTRSSPISVPRRPGATRTRTPTAPQRRLGRRRPDDLRGRRRRSSGSGGGRRDPVDVGGDRRLTVGGSRAGRPPVQRADGDPIGRRFRRGGR